MSNPLIFPGCVTEQTPSIWCSVAMSKEPNNLLFFLSALQRTQYNTVNVKLICTNCVFSKSDDLYSIGFVNGSYAFLCF